MRRASFDKVEFVRKKLQDLPEAERDEVVKFRERFEQEDVTDEEIDGAFTGSTRKLVYLVYCARTWYPLQVPKSTATLSRYTW